MKRFTDWMVVAGRRRGERARLVADERITDRRSRNDTTDGTMTRPVAGSAITRGVASSRWATRLLVVPRSMPTYARSTPVPTPFRRRAAACGRSAAPRESSWSPPAPPRRRCSRIGAVEVGRRVASSQAVEIVAQLVADRRHRADRRGSAVPAARAARSSSSCSCTSKTRAASAGGTRSLSRPSDSPCSSSQ